MYYILYNHTSTVVILDCFLIPIEDQVLAMLSALICPDAFATHSATSSLVGFV